MAANTNAETDTAAAAGQSTGGTHTADSRFSDVRNRADIDLDEAWGANVKRTYDMHQGFDMEGAGDRRAHANRAMTQALDFDQQMRALTMQHMQNGVTHAHNVSNQQERHADIAADRQWNVDEVAQLVANNGIFLDAVAASVVKAVNESK